MQWTTKSLNRVKAVKRRSEEITIGYDFLLQFLQLLSCRFIKNEALVHLKKSSNLTNSFKRQRRAYSGCGIRELWPLLSSPWMFVSCSSFEKHRIPFPSPFYALKSNSVLGSEFPSVLRTEFPSVLGTELPSVLRTEFPSVLCTDFIMWWNRADDETKTAPNRRSSLNEEHSGLFSSAFHRRCKITCLVSWLHQIYFRQSFTLASWLKIIRRVWGGGCVASFLADPTSPPE